MDENSSPYINSFKVDPKPTFSTYQFPQEWLNSIFIGILVTLITSILSRTASKFILRSEKGSFKYSDWLRAYIFASTDDPFRLISWLRGKQELRDDTPDSGGQAPTRDEEHDSDGNTPPDNDKRDDGSKAPSHKVRPQGLYEPLLVRWTLGLVTIAAIAISVNGIRELDACKRGHYRLVMDQDKASRMTAKVKSLPLPCWPIPVESDLGTVTSDTSYCAEVGIFDGPPIEASEERDAEFAAIVEHNDNGVVQVFIYSRARTEPFLAVGITTLVGWTVKRGGDKEYSEFRSFLGKDWDLNVHGRILTDGLGVATKGKCEQVGDIQLWDEKLKDRITPRYSAFYLNCNRAKEYVENFKAFKEAGKEVEKYIRGGLKWEKKDVVERAEVDDNGEFLKLSTDCPVTVYVQRPLVNILALLIVLIITLLINMGVTLCLRKAKEPYSDLMDDVFLILGTLLGRDTTCNPLQVETDNGTDTEKFKVENLNLTNWTFDNGRRTLRIHECAREAASA